MMTLKRDSYQPLYVQVERLLMERIYRKYKPGQLLPTQRQLADETGASLITIKRALDEIRRRGFIESVRGRGTIVRRPLVADDHRNVSSWSPSLEGVGVRPRTAWTRIDTRIPPREVAHLLGLKAREKTVRIRRLRTMDGEALSLVTNELPLKRVPGLPERGLDHESLYVCLRERYHLRPVSAHEEVVARPATHGERRLLGAGTKIVMVIRRHSLLEDGRPMDAAELIAPAHRYRYHVEIRSMRELDGR